MTALESYEKESKEKIDTCLNCTLPDYMCFGKGNCQKKIIQVKRKPGQLMVEVEQLLNQGMKYHTIAKTLGVSDSSVRMTIMRLRRNGKL